MNYPIQFGFPQVVLIILFFIGLLLLIFFIKGLVFREREIIELEDKDGNRFKRYSRARRHFRWHHATSGVVLVLISLLLLWVSFGLQAYLGLTGEILVARVHAASVKNQPHVMFVELVLFDQNGNQSSKDTYIVKGDQWMLQGNIVRVSSMLNMFGMHSGYKLTRLQGRFDELDMERNATHTVVELNGGDDDFFRTFHDSSWSWFITSKYGSAVFLPADGVTYNVYASQDALTAKPVQ
jgi:hypothetical protein